MKLGNKAFGSKEAIAVSSFTLFFFSTFEAPILKLAGWGLHPCNNESIPFKIPEGFTDIGSQDWVWGEEDCVIYFVYSFDRRAIALLPLRI